MPLTNADTESVVMMQQDLTNIMASVARISRRLQGLGIDAVIVPSGTLDFSQASNSDLIAVIAA